MSYRPHDSSRSLRILRPRAPGNEAVFEGDHGAFHMGKGNRCVQGVAGAGSWERRPQPYKALLVDFDVLEPVGLILMSRRVENTSRGREGSAAFYVVDVQSPVANNDVIPCVKSGHTWLF
jgi:hypothetical protein